MAPLGCVNGQASLLPRWRGAAPIQRSILEGDAVTGVSIMRIGHGVDTGGYCAQASCAVPGKSADELTTERAELGGDLLVRTLPAIADGSAVWTEQDVALVSHAAKIAKAELRLDPAAGALENIRRVMASSNAATARCVIAGKPEREMSARWTPSPGPPASVRTAGHGVALSKTAKLSPGRLVALRILIAARESGRYARELAADACASASLDTRDAAFARRLALGVTGCREDSGAWGCLE